MARTPASASASRIAIEDEVWEEAFAAPVRTGRRRAASRSAEPSWDRPILREAERVQRPQLRLAEPGQPPSPPHEPDPLLSAYATPADGGRRTIRIQGRGAEPFRSVTPNPSRNAAPLPGRLGSNPDRLAMWAMILGFLLVLVALLSSHF